MKKKSFVPIAKKSARALVACALSLAMMVPGTAVMNSAAVTAQAEETVDIPDPVMTINLERGIKGEGAKAAEDADEKIQAQQQGNGNGMKNVQSQKVLLYKVTEEAIAGSTNLKKYTYEYAPTISNGAYGGTYLSNQPLVVNDEQKGNVLKLQNAIHLERFVKTVSDELDEAYPVYTGQLDINGEPVKDEEGNVITPLDEASILQEDYTAYSQVSIKNPFAGMDFSEEPDTGANGEPIWYNGVTMTYWIKSPNKTNSSVLTFTNNALLGYAKNDLAKYNIIQMMEEEKAANGGTLPETSRFYVGTKATYVDAADESITYTVFDKVGDMCGYNPDYEEGSYKIVTGLGGTKAYLQGDESKTTVRVTAINAVKYWDAYHELPTVENPTGTDGKSQIPFGEVTGYFQLYANNSMCFCQDNLTGIQLNPNITDTYGTLPIGGYQARNMAGVYGDGLAVEDGEWHFVAVVLQNDHFEAYVDGAYIDPITDWMVYGGAAPFAASSAANKSFNLGWGWEGANGYSDPMDSAKNGNTSGMLLLDWLSDPNTRLSIGGLAPDLSGSNSYFSAEEMTLGTTEVMLDDLNFYAEKLDEEQIFELYAQGYEALMAEESEEAPEAISVMKLQDLNDATMLASNTARRENAEDPTIVTDPVMGKVVKLNKSYSNETSAVKLASNPFAGNDELTGATISYWIKQDAEENGTIAESVAVSFVDEPKYCYHEKMQASAKDTKASSILYTKSNGKAEFIEGSSARGVVDSLKNSYTFMQSEEKAAETLASNAEWHYVTVVMTNSGIQPYIDGVKLEQANENIGARFYDGYYTYEVDRNSTATYNGGFKYLQNYTNNLVFGGCNNAGARSLLSFLTAEDTALYLGYANNTGSATEYQTTSETYLYKLSFYDEALNDTQIANLYAQAKENDPEPVAYTLGDVNGDEKINADDALAVLKHAASIEMLDETMQMAADVNGDEKINADDALLILKYAASIIHSFE